MYIYITDFTQVTHMYLLVLQQFWAWRMTCRVSLTIEDTTDTSSSSCKRNTKIMTRNTRCMNIVLFFNNNQQEDFCGKEYLNCIVHGLALYFHESQNPWLGENTTQDKPSSTRWQHHACHMTSNQFHSVAAPYLSHDLKSVPLGGSTTPVTWPQISF